MIDVRYQIRKSIAEANAASGINKLLCDIAELDEQIKLYNDHVMTYNAREEVDVVQKKIVRNEKELSKDSTSYLSHHPDKLMVTVLDKTDITKCKEVLKIYKRKKQDLNDLVLKINSNSDVDDMIELSAETVKVLRGNFLI